MFTLSGSHVIHAPIERCFALSTRIEVVRPTLGMTPVGGVTRGHVELGSRVVWRGWKFGLPTEHHTLITLFAAPHIGTLGDPATQREGQRVAWFEDQQERGRFKDFRHIHLFRELEDGSTELEDHIWFALPFGPLGAVAARVIMLPHIRALLRDRFARIQRLAETDAWREFIDAA